jgi:hypothetical protein
MLGLSEHVAGGFTTGLTWQVRFTVTLKPLRGAMVIVEVADPPAVTVAGEIAVLSMAKSGWAAPGVTVRPTETLWLTEPEVALTVMFEVPPGVTSEVVTVRVEVAGVGPGTRDGGTNEQFAPKGRPEHVSVTGALTPFVAVSVMVEVPDWPAPTDKLAGAALKLKSGSNPYTSN